MISVISPIYNEEDNLEELVQRTIQCLESTGEPFEFLLVDNGSRDHSLEMMKSWHARDSRIRYISLSRNFNHQGGMLAGIAYAKGDAVVSMDGDLQHPPELIPEMVRLWKEGHEVVFTKKKAISEWGVRAICTKLFYEFISHLTDLHLSYGQSDFRLLDRKVVDTLLHIPERDKFIRGLVEWIGFRQIGIEYDVPPRKRGKSKFSMMQYLSFAVDGLFSFSKVPLRYFLWAGLFVAVICLSFGGIYAYEAVCNIMGWGNYVLPSGWATLTVSVFFLGAVQLIGIGILGEYIGRIFFQIKQRPEFIVKEKKLD